MDIGYLACVLRVRPDFGGEGACSCSRRILRPSGVSVGERDRATSTSAAWPFLDDRPRRGGERLPSARTPAGRGERLPPDDRPGEACCRSTCARHPDPEPRGLGDRVRKTL